jgi:hypothetical protein
MCSDVMPGENCGRGGVMSDDFDLYDFCLLGPGHLGQSLDDVLRGSYPERCKVIRDMFEATEESIDPANETIVSVAYLRTVAIMLGVGPFFNDLLDSAKIAAAPTVHELLDPKVR